MSVTIFRHLCHLYHFILKDLYLQNVSYFTSSQFSVQGWTPHHFAGVKRNNVHSSFCTPINWGIKVDPNWLPSPNKWMFTGSLGKVWERDTISKGNHSYSPFLLSCFGTIIISGFSKTKKTLLRICLASEIMRRFCLKIRENYQRLLKASVDVTSPNCNDLKVGILVRLVI